MLTGMPSSKRRRWHSLSLRTLMMGMTLASVWFWWYFHHRGSRVAEKARLQKLYGTLSGSVGSERPAVELEFHDVLFAWELPNPEPRAGDPWWWLRPVTAPRLHSVDLYIGPGRPLTDEAVELARSVPCLRVRSSRLPPDVLERLLTPRTEELFLYPEVRADKLAVIGQASHLRVLSLRCPSDAAAQSSDCAWLQSCRELDTIYAEAHDPAFLAQIGHHLGGVERLHLISADQNILSGLADWRRLRYLSIEYVQFSDALLLPLEPLGPHLEKLEIYHGDVQKLTPAGLATIKSWHGLRSLKIGDGQLSAPHLTALAELPQLWQLSIRTQHLTPAQLQPLSERSQLQLLDLDEAMLTISPAESL
jgi:hypothetical protein